MNFEMQHQILPVCQDAKKMAALEIMVVRKRHIGALFLAALYLDAPPRPPTMGVGVTELCVFNKVYPNVDESSQNNLILIVIMSTAADSVASWCSGQRETRNDFSWERLSGGEKTSEGAQIAIPTTNSVFESRR